MRLTLTVEDTGNRTTLLAHTLDVSPLFSTILCLVFNVLLDQTLDRPLTAPGIHVYLYASLQSHLFGTEMIRVTKGFCKPVPRLQPSTMSND